jgi:hypothetical protein
VYLKGGKKRMDSFDESFVDPSQPEKQHAFRIGAFVELLKEVVDDDVLYFHNPGERGVVRGYSGDFVICKFGRDTVCRPESWFTSVDSDSENLTS